MATIWLIIKILLSVIFLNAFLNTLFDIIELLIDWRWHFYGLESNTIPKSTLNELTSFPKESVEIEEFELTGIYVCKDENNKPYGSYSFHFTNNLGGQYQIGTEQDRNPALTCFNSFMLTAFLTPLFLLNPVGLILFWVHRLKVLHKKITDNPRVIIRNANSLGDKTVNSPVSVMKIYSEFKFDDTKGR
jgi:hypothetical protein